MGEDGHEQFGGAADQDTIQALASELQQLYRRQWLIGTCAVRQPKDLCEPADLVLAGTIHDGAGIARVVISQRVVEKKESSKAGDSEVSFLMQLRRERMVMCLVTPRGAWQIHDGMPPLSFSGAIMFRRAIHPEFVDWNPIAAWQNTRSDHYLWLQRFQTGSTS